MLHPILSTLPPLTEGFESTEQKPPDYQTEFILSPSPSDDVKHESGDEPLRGSRLPDVDLIPDVKRGVETKDDDDNVKQEPPESSSNVPITPPTPDLATSIPPDHDVTLPTSPSEAFPQSETETKPEPNPLAASLDMDMPMPTAPIPLPTILAHSDSLFAQYPPEHSQLRLSSIMGPQSVVFTWSENFSDLPSDTTAEAMVGRPELVSYPIEPEEMEGSEEEGEDDEESDSDSEYNDKKPGKTRRKRKSGKVGEKGGLQKRTRRKTIKKKVQKLLKIFGATTGAGQQITHVDGRTVVTGAVLVLAVAIAVYNVKAQDGVSGLEFGGSNAGGIGASIGVGLEAGLNMLGGNRHGLQEELKKIANVLVGVGAKYLHLPA